MKFKIQRLFSGALCAGIATGTLLLHCGEVSTNSLWVEKGSIAIDGNPVEWQSRLDYRKNLKAGIGMMNDSDYLYCCIVSFNSEINRQIMEGGLTLWFKRTGKKNEIVGVRFPVHGMRRGIPGRTDRDFNEKPEFPIQQEEKLFREIEILGPVSGDKRLLSLEDSTRGSLDAAVNFKDGKLVYELQIPKRQSVSPQFFCAMENDSILLVSMETHKMGAPGGPSGNGGRGGGGPPHGGGGMGMGGGGGPGMGVGGGGRGGGGPPGGGPGGDGVRPQAAEPFKLELKVHLSMKQLQ